MFGSVMNFAGENEVRWVTFCRESARSSRRSHRTRVSTQAVLAAVAKWRADQIQNCATLGIREVSCVQGQHALALKELTQQ